MDQKLGAFICWSMPSFTQDDIVRSELPINTFAPTGLDVDNWLDAAVSAGAKYAILTVKAPDGLALWPTEYHVTNYEPYSIAQTTWYANNGEPDVTQLFVDGCRERGLSPVLYYCVYDYTFANRTGLTPWTGTAQYLAMITQQITELLTNYGDITALWLDAWINWSIDVIPVAPIYRLVKRLQPNCLFITNNTTGPNDLSQIDVYEGTGPAADNTRPAEHCNTIRAAGGTWYYHSGEAQGADSLRDAASINAEIQTAISRGACYALDIQPTTAGVLTPAQVALLGEIHV